MPDDKEGFRAAHKRNAKVKDDPTPPLDTPTTPVAPFEGIPLSEVSRILEDASERAHGDLADDVRYSQRLVSVLARDALVRGLIIVTQAQRDCLAGKAPWPKDEIAGLKALADIGSAAGGLSLAETNVDTRKPPAPRDWEP